MTDIEIYPIRPYQVYVCQMCVRWSNYSAASCYDLRGQTALHRFLLLKTRD